jgi:hypothetical protein
MCPNPDRTLAWQDDADFGDGVTIPRAKDFDAMRLSDYEGHTLQDYYLTAIAERTALQSEALIKAGKDARSSAAKRAKQHAVRLSKKR